MRKDRGKLRSRKVIDADRLNLLHGDLAAGTTHGADRAAFTREDVLASVGLARAEGATTQLDTGFFGGCADLAFAIAPRNNRGSGGSREKADFHDSVLGQGGSSNCEYIISYASGKVKPFVSKECQEIFSTHIG